MDTKLKRLSHSIIIKIVLFLLIVTAFSLLVSGFIIDEMKTKHSIISVLDNKTFYESQLLNSRIYSDINKINKQLELNEKLADTQKKDYISKERLFENVRENYEIESVEALETLDEEVINSIKEDLINEDVSKINREISNYSNINNVKYYLSTDSVKLSNTNNSDPDFYKSSTIHIINDQKQNKIAPEAFKSYNHSSYYLEEISQKSDLFYMSFTEDAYKSLKGDYLYTKRIAENRLRLSIIFFLVGLVSLLLLMIIIGRNGIDREVKMNFIDKLYTDINIVLISIIVVVYILIISEFIQMGIESLDYYISFTVLAFAITLLLTLSLIKHLKKGSFIKHSFIYTILAKIFYGIGSIFRIGSLGLRIIFLLAGYTVLILFSVLLYPLTFFIVPLLFGLMLWFINIKGINEIKTGIRKIKEGILDYEIEINRKGELKSFAKEVNSIGEGLKNALRNEIRSEKLKTELITNVSHDLRTPLTSIITYIDLLKTETDNEKKEKYINVLAKNSNRLKLLTEGLFEVSKLNSGNIEVEKSTIDLVALINQGLGEYERQIEDNSLDFKVDTSDQENIYVIADGNLTWRAIDNIFSNIIKYALENSRVYIDIDLNASKVMLTFKNISNYELNIPPEDLLLRFTRGDESRNSEGSGLGLSIAKSLVEVQNGKFDIVIDGDLFKVIIELVRDNSISKKEKE